MTIRAGRCVIYIQLFLGTFLVLLGPSLGFAQTITFSPTSPQIYDGTSDVTFTATGLVASQEWVGFDTSDNYAYGGFDYTQSPTTDAFSAGFGVGNFQSWAGGIGTANFLLVEQTGSWIADCATPGFSTLSTCLASAAYQGTDVPYVFTTASSPLVLEATSSVDQTEQNLWFAYWTMFATMVFVVWLFRNKSP